MLEERCWKQRTLAPHWNTEANYSHGCFKGKLVVLLVKGWPNGG